MDIKHSIECLRNEKPRLCGGVDVVLTYGDPNYYHQVGFHAITPSQVRPPLPLSMPYGWLGQALALGGEPHLRGPSSCVTALNDPALW